MKLPQNLSALSHIRNLAFMSAFVVHLLSHAAPPSCSVTPICILNIRNIERTERIVQKRGFPNIMVIPTEHCCLYQPV